MTLAIVLAVVLIGGITIGAWAKRWSRRTATQLIYGDGSSDPNHVHGAWCHPSADGCPDRPGM